MCKTLILLCFLLFGCASWKTPDSDFFSDSSIGSSAESIAVIWGKPLTIGKCKISVIAPTDQSTDTVSYGTSYRFELTSGPVDFTLLVCTLHTYVIMEIRSQSTKINGLQLKKSQQLSDDSLINYLLNKFGIPALNPDNDLQT